MLRASPPELTASDLRRETYDGLEVSSDSHERATEADFVLGVGPSSRMLAQLTIRRSVDAALDLGTGSGVQALLASRHADRRHSAPARRNAPGANVHGAGRGGGPDGGVHPRRGARPDVRLRLAARTRLPGHDSGVRRPDAIFPEAATADVRQPRGSLRQVPLPPDRCDQGNRDGEGRRCRPGLPPPDARSVHEPRQAAFSRGLHDHVLRGRDPDHQASPRSFSSCGPGRCA